MTPEERAEKIFHLMPLQGMQTVMYNSCIDAITAQIREAEEEAREAEFIRLMGHSWPKGMREDLRQLLTTRNFQGEIDLNWMDDTIGEMLTLATIKARHEGFLACREKAVEIAADHNGCVDVKCLRDSNCGATAENQIRALQPEDI